MTGCFYFINRAVRARYARPGFSILTADGITIFTGLIFIIHIAFVVDGSNLLQCESCHRLPT